MAFSARTVCLGGTTKAASVNARRIPRPRKFMAGHVVGGRVFGYDNVDVLTADGRRSHVVRQVNLDEAAVVRRIFSLCAEGVGQVRIARMLNAEGARAPQPRKGGPQAWAPSSAREVLFREAYRGRAVWNRKRKRNDWGAVQRAPKPESAWHSVERPDLRVVSDAEWDAAHRRLARARVEYDQVTHGLRKRTVDRDSVVPAGGLQPVRSVRREALRAVACEGQARSARALVLLPLHVELALRVDRLPARPALADGGD